MLGSRLVLNSKSQIPVVRLRLYVSEVRDEHSAVFAVFKQADWTQDARVQNYLFKCCTLPLLYGGADGWPDNLPSTQEADEAHIRAEHPLRSVYSIRVQ